MRQPLVLMTTELLLVETRTLLCSEIPPPPVTLTDVTRLLVTQLVNDVVTNTVDAGTVTCDATATTHGDATGARTRTWCPTRPR